MPLATLEKDRVNIKDLTLDRPERQNIPFDPERDITDVDWEGIKAYTKSLYEDETKPLGWKRLLAEELASIKILFPERIEEFNLARAWEELKSEELPFSLRPTQTVPPTVTQLPPTVFPPLRLTETPPPRPTVTATATPTPHTHGRTDPGSDWEDFLFRDYFQAAFKIVFPDKVTEVAARHAVHALKASLTPRGTVESWPPQMAFIAKIISPGEFEDFLKEDDRRAMMEFLAGTKNSGSKFNVWRPFYSTAFYLRGIYGQTSQELGVGSDEWVNMKKILNNIRTDTQRNPTGGWYAFTKHALYMAALAAQEVSITDSGITLTKNQPSFENQVPAVPQVRKF